mmetsp:Transcript_42813/g.99970  ORF Transcript_42813/g.99970 Transcript_42813/m.99970 type:complete len:241 (-) Transcript_42813:795-1517(-)
MHTKLRVVLSEAAPKFICAELGAAKLLRESPRREQGRSLSLGSRKSSGSQWRGTWPGPLEWSLAAWPLEAQNVNRAFGLTPVFDFFGRCAMVTAAIASASAAAAAAKDAADRAFSSITVVAVKIFWPAARKRPFRSLAEACARSGTVVTPMTDSFCSADCKSASDQLGRACSSSCRRSVPTSGSCSSRLADSCGQSRSCAAAARSCGCIQSSSAAMARAKPSTPTACSMKSRFARRALLA